eukprot:364742-Chlamydomonas_euryale.AAC.5
MTCGMRCLPPPHLHTSGAGYVRPGGAQQGHLGQRPRDRLHGSWRAAAAQLDGRLAHTEHRPKALQGAWRA